jgi:hypothetical protein
MQQVQAPFPGSREEKRRLGVGIEWNGLSSLQALDSIKPPVNFPSTNGRPELEAHLEKSRRGSIKETKEPCPLTEQNLRNGSPVPPATRPQSREERSTPPPLGTGIGGNVENGITKPTPGSSEESTPISRPTPPHPSSSSETQSQPDHVQKTKSTSDDQPATPRPRGKSISVRPQSIPCNGVASKPIQDAVDEAVAGLDIKLPTVWTAAVSHKSPEIYKIRRRDGVYMARLESAEVRVPPDALARFRDKVEHDLLVQLHNIRSKLQSSPATQRVHVFDSPELRMSGKKEGSDQVVLSPTIWIPCATKGIAKKLEDQLKDSSFTWAHKAGFGKIMTKMSSRLTSVPSVGEVKPLDMKLGDGFALQLHIEARRGETDRLGGPIVCCSTLTMGDELLVRNYSRIGGMVSINGRHFGLTSAHGLLGGFWNARPFWSGCIESGDADPGNGSPSARGGHGGHRGVDPFVDIPELIQGDEGEGEGSADGNEANDDESTSDDSTLLGTIDLASMPNWQSVELGDCASFIQRKIIYRDGRDAPTSMTFQRDSALSDFALVDASLRARWGSTQAVQPVELPIWPPTARVETADTPPQAVDVILDLGERVRGRLLPEPASLTILGLALPTRMISLELPLGETPSTLSCRFHNSI